MAGKLGTETLVIKLQCKQENGSVSVNQEGSFTSGDGEVERSISVDVTQFTKVAH